MATASRRLERVIYRELRQQIPLPILPASQPVTLAEIEERLGKSAKWCSRRTAGEINWRRMIARDAMPDPICSTGTPAWDRHTFDAWFARAHPYPQKQERDAPRAHDDWHAAAREHYGT